MSGPVIVLDGKLSKFPHPLFPKGKVPFTIGFRFAIPPTIGEKIFELSFPQLDMELMEAYIGFNGYSDLDCWSLIIDGSYLAKDIYTKEYSQCKKPSVVKKFAKESTNHKFIFKNNSGTHKIGWLDLHCIGNAQVEFKEGLEIRPSSVVVGRSKSFDYKAYYVVGNYEKDVTNECDWSSTKFGIIHGTLGPCVDVLSGVVTAKYKERTATATFRVAPRSIEVRPDNIDLELYEDQPHEMRYACFYTYDGVTTDVTDTCTWWTTKFTISKGLVTGINSAGSGRVSATYDGATDWGDFNIVIPVLEIRPNTADVTVGKTQQFNAFRILGTVEEDVTNLCTWTTTKFAITKGLLKSVTTPGTGTVKAVLGTLSATATFEALEGVLTLTPTSKDGEVGDTIYYKAYWTYDGVQTEVTNDCTWSTTKYSINKGALSQITTAGTGTVTAVYSGKTKTATFRIVSVTETFEIRPTDIRLDLNQTYQFNVYYKRVGLATVETNVSNTCGWSTTNFSIYKGKLSNTNSYLNGKVTASYNNLIAEATFRVSFIVASRVILKLWDTGAEDNDTVNVLVNNKYVANNIVLKNRYQEFDGTWHGYKEIVLILKQGVNVVKIEAVRSDAGDCTSGVIITDLAGNQLYLTDLAISVPREGIQTPPYPFITWSCEVP